MNLPVKHHCFSLAHSFFSSYCSPALLFVPRIGGSPPPTIAVLDIMVKNYGILDVCR